MVSPREQTTQMGAKRFGIPPTFDPEAGTTIFEPESKGYGNWIGGHGAVYDPDTDRFYLYHRVRSPLGEGRGKTCRIAVSDDGIDFDSIWEADADAFRARSLEVGSLIRDRETGRWRLYVSYEDAHLGQWRVDLVEAQTIEQLDPYHHRTVFQPEDFGVDLIKDPRVYEIGGLFHAFLNVPARTRVEENDAGQRNPVGQDATALAVSEDGKHWRDFEYVFEPGRGAPGDRGGFRARINSIVYLPPVYVGFIDTGETFYDNYEESAGLAISHDLRNWRRVTRSDPWVESPHGCVRYVDALRVGDEMYYYYEYTREDGSHDLRVSVASLA